MGPEGLRASLGKLWKLWQTQLAAGPGYASLFVDDFFISGEASSAKKDLGRLLHLLGICGYEVSAEKFQDNSPAVRLLGVQIERRESSVIIRCEDRREETQEKLRRLYTHVTKKDVFALAGVLGYDVILNHPESRIIADLLRSVVGKYRDDWKRTLALQPEDQQFVKHLLDWAMEIMTSPACSHVTEPQRDKIRFRLETDASKYGFAYVLKHVSASGKPCLVHEGTGRWKKAQLNYHVNRWEGYALLMGLRTLSMFLQFLNESRLGGELPIVEIAAYTDSTTALSWAKRGSIDCQVSYKSLEYRSILMLAEALKQEMDLLTALGATVTLTHIEGTGNSDADRLSRLLYRPIGGEPMGALLNAKKTEIETAAAVKDDEEPLIELLARDSYDLRQLLHRLACLRTGHARLGGRLDDWIDALDPWGEENLTFLGKIAQRAGVIPHRKQYVEREGILIHEQTAFNGRTKKQIVIPAGLGELKVLILKYYHRKNGHRGKRYDIGNSSDVPFYLEGIHTTATTVIRRCITCSVKNAPMRSGFAAPVQTIARDTSLPPFTRVSIDFLHHKLETIFSALCTDTGAVFLTMVDRPSAAGAIQGMKRLSRIYCVQYARIHSDNAQALSNRFRALAKSEWPGAEFSNTAPYASHQNPVERAHRDVWSVLRARKFSKLLTEETGPLNNEILEEVGYILNRRPLGVYRDGTVITPAVLAWGASYGRDGESLQTLKKYFYEEIFHMFRRRHLPSRYMRRNAVSVGQIVLAQLGPVSDKMEFSHTIGKIVAMTGNVVTVKNSSATFNVASNAVVPLNFAD